MLGRRELDSVAQADADEVLMATAAANHTPMQPTRHVDINRIARFLVSFALL